jgi:hypothetical protein
LLLFFGKKKKKPHSNRATILRGVRCIEVAGQCCGLGERIE